MGEVKLRMPTVNSEKDDHDFVVIPILFSKLRARLFPDSIAQKANRLRSVTLKMSRLRRLSHRMRKLRGPRANHELAFAFKAVQLSMKPIRSLGVDETNTNEASPPKISLTRNRLRIRRPEERSSTSPTTSKSKTGESKKTNQGGVIIKSARYKPLKSELAESMPDDDVLLTNGGGIPRSLTPIRQFAELY